MSKVFDMELFLAAVLTGSHSTQQRHLRQLDSSNLRALAARDALGLVEKACGLVS